MCCVKKIEFKIQIILVVVGLDEVVMLCSCVVSLTVSRVKCVDIDQKQLVYEAETETAEAAEYCCVNHGQGNNISSDRGYSSHIHMTIRKKYWTSANNDFELEPGTANNQWFCY